MKLIIGNVLSEEYGFDVNGLTPEAMVSERSGSFQSLWSARDGDIVLLPVHPDKELLAYITGLTRVDPLSLKFVIPPAKTGGEYVLTRERLLDPEFLSTMRKLLSDQTVDEIFALSDSTVAHFASELGIAEAMPGHALFAQGGATLVNSKAAFRAIGAGASIPIPDGGVFSGLHLAVEMVTSFIERGRHVIVKRDLGSGGTGNIVLTVDSALVPVGAKRAVTVQGSDDVAGFLENSWDWLTGGGRRPLVVEEYFDASIAVFAELLITDSGIRLQSCGEIVSAPTVTAQMMPPPELDDAAHAVLTSSAFRLCEPLSAMGYRGIVGADAILTPDHRILFTECNARLTGSTLIYDDIGNGIVGNDRYEQRLLLERRYWYVRSFTHAIDQLHAAGVAYDQKTRKGIILSRGYDDFKRMVRFCVVGESWAEMQNMENALMAVGGGR